MIPPSLTAAPEMAPAEETDLFVWLSERWWTPWALCAICLLVGGWMVRSLLHHRGREREVARAAAASGMRYSEQDPHGLARLDFDHFPRGEGEGWTATNVVTSERDGGLAAAFDVRVWTEYEIEERPDGERRLVRVGREGRPGRLRTRKHRGSTRTAAVVRLPVNVPRLVVARENLASKLFASATRLDLDVESEAFNRAYHVICSDRRFARTMLDARVVDLIVSTEGRISFEFVGTWALLHTVRLEPELVPGLVRLAEELRSVVPRLVVEGWPSAGSPGRSGSQALPG